MTVDKLVRRITAVPRGGGDVTVVYEERRGERKSSEVLRPVEKVVRRLLKADVIRANETLKLHDESKQQGKDEWLLDAPANALKANRKGYNEARKAVPYRILPKA